MVSDAMIEKFAAKVSDHSCIQDSLMCSIGKDISEVNHLYGIISEIIDSNSLNKKSSVVVDSVGEIIGRVNLISTQCKKLNLNPSPSVSKDLISSGLKWARENCRDMVLSEVDLRFSFISNYVTIESDGMKCELGTYKIEITFNSNGKMSTRIVAECRKNLIKSYASTQHPHANRAGVICFGEYIRALKNFIKLDSIPDVVELVMTVLNSYNPQDAYAQLEEFIGIKKCLACGSYTTEECGVCNYAKCSNCNTVCCTCEVSGCVRCNTAVDGMRMCLTCRKRDAEARTSQTVSTEAAIQ